MGGVSALYPASFAEIAAWARVNGVAPTEGRVRFAQYGILRAVTGVRSLSRMLVFKGGNALDFIWQPNRSTRDLDFSADMATIEASWDAAKAGDFLGDQLKRGLTTAGRDLGVVYAIQRMRRQPPGADKTFVAYELRVGYALPDQERLLRRMREGLPSQQVIPVDINLNEPICADRAIDVRGSFPLRGSTIEDIVAEKLRALLQQPIRNRYRCQDLLDIAVILQAHPNLDRDVIADFLRRKAGGRDVPVSRAAFRDPEIAARASPEYAALVSTTRTAFIPLRDAFAMLYAFIDTLPIPDTAPE